jgi:hypothetical protein
MLRHVVAKRRYDLRAPSGEQLRLVTISFGRPVKREEHVYRCFFRIDGLPWGGLLYAEGTDGVSALLPAMVRAGTHLYHSEEFKNGLITLHGSPNLGLPAINGDLVPDPMLTLTV